MFSVNLDCKYIRSIPNALKVLNKYESMIIKSRVTCSFMWRRQGMIGQYARARTPLAFVSPVFELFKTFFLELQLMLSNKQEYW